jgi:hypothetical protein
MQGCVIRWARESNKLVCELVLAKGAPYVKSHNLAEDYFDDVWEEAEEQIAKAGVRLAAWMNAIAAIASKDIKSGTTPSRLGDGEL